MSEPVVTLALVGCGWISEAHVTGYRRLWEAGCRELRITACCDLNPEAARIRARQIGEFQGAEPAVFASVGELLASGIASAADICLPHCFHHQAAIPLLEGGMHVQLEKPLGITVRASRAIIAAAARAGRVLATAENTRRHLGARAAAWAVRSGLIGEPVHGQVCVVRDDPINVEDPKWAWRNVRAINGGGPLIDSGAHFTDMMLRLFGPVEEIACTTRMLQPRTAVRVPVIGETVVDVEDWWQADLRFASGMHVAWSFTSKLPGLAQSGAAYYGREGVLIDRGGWPLHPFEGGGEIRTRGAGLAPAELESRYLASLRAEERARLFPFGVTDSFAIEVWDFVDAIRSPRRPEMAGEDGLEAKALCLACYESSAIAGRPVRIAEVLSGTVDAYQRPIDARWGLLAQAARA